MRAIVITRPDFFMEEASLVNRLFAAGMERLHLRKPGASEEQLAEWLRSIDSRFHRSIVLHDCFSLVKSFHLGGVHLNSRNPQVPGFLSMELSSGQITV